MLLLSKFKIHGHSMEPEIQNNQVVLVSGLPYWFIKPRINDIVAFGTGENKIMIKRISKIEENRYYLTGDNKSDSLDSRNFGYVPEKQILGKVIFKF